MIQTAIVRRSLHRSVVAGALGGTIVALGAWMFVPVVGESPEPIGIIMIGVGCGLVCSLACLAGACFGWKRGVEDGRLEMTASVRKMEGEIKRNRALSRRRVRALSSAVASRLNNVLMVMLGAIEMAKRRTEDEVVLCELDTVRSGIDDAGNICRRLSRLRTEGRRGAVPKTDLVDHFTRLQVSMRAKLGSRMRLRTEIDARTLLVTGSSQALDHLILNAVNAHVQSIQLNGELQIRAWRGGVDDVGRAAHAWVTMEIESPGATELEISREFLKGMLALPGTTHEAVRKGRARITRIAFPSQEEEMAAGFETGSWRNPVSEDILVVENDPQVQALIERMLGTYGCSIRTATDLSEASGIIMAHSASIGLAIIDVRLPGGSGLRLAEAIRNRFPRIPVLLMSGSGACTLPDRLAADSAVVLLRKPFIQGAFDDAIERLVPLNDLSVVAP